MKQLLSHWWWKYSDHLPGLNDNAKQSLPIIISFIGFFTLMLIVLHVGEKTAPALPSSTLAYASDQKSRNISEVITTTSQEKDKTLLCNAP